MRHVLRAALFAVALIVPLSVPAAVSVRLHAPVDCSPLVLKQLQKETERIARPAELELAWNEPVAQGRMVVVTLQGDCAATTVAGRARGAMGWASVIDGQVQPFITIDSDRVRATIAPELERADGAVREAMLGRALGRVLAHELYHALGSRTDHDHDGLTQARLRPADLVRGSFFLSAADVRPEPARDAVTRTSSPSAPEPSDPAPLDYDDLGR